MPLSPCYASFTRPFTRLSSQRCHCFCFVKLRASKQLQLFSVTMLPDYKLSCLIVVWNISMIKREGKISVCQRTPFPRDTKANTVNPSVTKSLYSLYSRCFTASTAVHWEQNLFAVNKIPLTTNYFVMMKVHCLWKISLELFFVVAAL